MRIKPNTTISLMFFSLFLFFIGLSNEMWQHNISQSVPKFGDWDERDPKSGERFTAIFNKVKEERQVGSSNLAPVAQRPSNYPDSQAAKHEGVKVSIN